MLPTLAVILWAYGMYALVRAWSRRKGGQYLGRSRGTRYAPLALVVMGTGAALALVLWLSLADEQPDHGLKLAGFLGTVWAEGRPEKAGSRLEVPQIKGQTTGGHPVYALLHPETPAGQLDAEKAKPAPRRLQKPKVRKGAAVQAKAGKPAPPAQKKEKLATKSQPKKKKPAVPAGAPIAAGG